MSRILIAWEMGGNFGHIAQLLPLARALRQRGHLPLFVVKDIATAEQLLAPEHFTFLQAPPRPAPHNTRGTPPTSFADILSRAGFGSSEGLAGMVAGWHACFANIHPHVLVVQYAPVAQFAARLFGLPCLQLNTGFESPPEKRPYPCFEPRRKVARDQLLAREDEILQHINAVATQHGSRRIPRLQEAIKADLNLLLTLPELDHYQSRTKGNYIGPIWLTDGPTNLQWTHTKAPRIFLYLRHFRGLDVLLETLAATKAEVIACIPDCPNDLVTTYSSSTDEPLRLVTSPVSLSPLLPMMDLVISHAGHGLAAAALLAGVPMLLLPTTVEQWMLSAKIEALGAGKTLRKESVADQLPAALTTLLMDRSFRAQAQRLAQTYAGYDQAHTIERLVKTIERLPGRFT